VAVSGGVDSVVLLDMIAAQKTHEIIVAHFDHGIRSDSQDDARFVEGLANKYDFPFVSHREELGAQASEEYARLRRYLFLREAAKSHGAVIVTAHHADDAMETIAINLVRGTGWRGVAGLSSASIVRPLVHLSKDALRQYAHDNRLEWVEDSTNASDTYLRNRVRRRIAQLDDVQRQKLLAIWNSQIELKKTIDEEVARHVDNKHEHNRYVFTHSEETAAKEMLRGAITVVTGVSPTRPQVERALLAIKTARAGTVWEVGGGVSLVFTTRTFIVRTS
jgi:tRNA(Ile)-lysidine synthase